MLWAVNNVLIGRKVWKFLLLSFFARANSQVLCFDPQAQKEQYLTYRRVFHGDTKDIFQHGATSASRPVPRRPVDTTGPTPFPGITNTAAAAMASILNRPQQPHGEFLIQAW